MHRICCGYAHLVEGLHAVACEDRSFCRLPLFIRHAGHSGIQFIDNRVEVSRFALAVVDVDAKFLELVGCRIRRRIKVSHRTAHSCRRFRSGDVLLRQSQESNTCSVRFLPVARRQSRAIRHGNAQHIDVR